MSWGEVKYALNGSLGTGTFLSLDKMLIANSLMSNNDAQIDWAFRQYGVGGALNAAFGLESTALAACNTVNEIAASTAAINAIKTNSEAVAVCCKNSVLIQKFSDEDIIAAGSGYMKFNVGDLITLSYNGNATNFRVVHKNYLTQNKIVLLAEDCAFKKAWNTNDINNYSTSTIRSYLNSTVLNGFSQKNQNAITTPNLQCHDNKTEKILNDKIWLPSHEEMGYSTGEYAPVEGSTFSYYNGAENSKRIKKFNGKSVLWWLRTPYTYSNRDVWHVIDNGGANGGGSSNSYGVAFAFEI